MDSSPENYARYQFWWKYNKSNSKIININASLWYSEMTSFRKNEGILVQISNIHILVTMQVIRLKFGSFPCLYSMNLYAKFHGFLKTHFQAPIFCLCLMWNFPAPIWLFFSLKWLFVDVPSSFITTNWAIPHHKYH